MKNKYYVYEHWLDNKCFYVGKGSGRRAFNLWARKDLWKDFVKDRIEEIKIKIIKEFDNEEDAFNFEVEQSIKRRLEGYKIIGMIGKESGFKGKKHSKEVKKILSKLKKDKPLSEETKKKLSENHYIKRGGIPAMLGKKHSYETKKKMKENHPDTSGENNAMYGKHGKDNPNSKIVYIIKDNKIINKCYSTQEASNITGVKQVRAYARGTSNHFHKKTGYYFYYKEFLPTSFIRIRDDKNEVSYS